MQSQTSKEMGEKTDGKEREIQRMVNERRRERTKDGEREREKETPGHNPRERKRKKR